MLCKSGSKYLFFPLVFSYQVERDGVERAGHDAEHAAEDERGDHVGKEPDQAGTHAEHEVAHEVQRLQTDVRQQEPLHVWKHQQKKEGKSMKRGREKRGLVRW